MTYDLARHLLTIDFLSIRQRTRQPQDMYHRRWIWRYGLSFQKTFSQYFDYPNKPRENPILRCLLHAKMLSEQTAFKAVSLRGIDEL